MPHAYAQTLKTFNAGGAAPGRFYSLPELARQMPNVARLPVSLRIVLESVLRNCDGKKVTTEHVTQLANWKPTAERVDEIPFVVARVVLQDFTGVPLLADLAAMRNVAAEMGKNPKTIEPLVPVDLVVDHSIMIDHYGTKNALDLNMKLEFQRNQERYEFMKWGMQAFDTFGVVPPGFGIVHQVNLEYLARGVHAKDGVYYPDTLVGTDSHTTMINGIGVVAWGVGGIEAEAGMLGQPVYFLTPDVVGFELSGRLREGVTATDLVLTVTEILRKEKVVGKFVEFFGPGTESLAVPDRATIANMAPEYGATMGFFPVDAKTIEYFRGTGRTREEIAAFEAYFRAQGLFGVPKAGDIDYTNVVKLDLGTVAPSLAGPKRPQDRIEITPPVEQVQAAVQRADRRQRLQPAGGQVCDALSAAADGFGRRPARRRRQGGARRRAAQQGRNVREPADARRRAGGGRRGRPCAARRHHRQRRRADRRHHVLHQHQQPRRAAGRRPAGEEGGRGGAHGASRTSRPRSRRARASSPNTSRRPGCCRTSRSSASTSPPTAAPPASAMPATWRPRSTRRSPSNDLVCAAVLSGNRNFEARIHPNLKANFLASPPLVVAYAIAGTVTKDLMTEPVGTGRNGKDGVPGRHLARPAKRCTR